MYIFCKMMRVFFACFTLAFLSLGAAPKVFAISLNTDEAPFKCQVTVASASNFYQPLITLLDSSETLKQADLRVVSGSSGSLYAQILAGAPFDVFLSADAERPAGLFESGMSHAPLTYAKGKLAIWSTQYRFAGMSLDEIKTTVDSSSGRIAIANPETAPFGQAAWLFIKHTFDDDQIADVRKRLVFGNNVAQTFQFVDTGNAHIGIIAESMLIQAQVKFPDKSEKYTSYSLLGENNLHSILQQAVILKQGRPYSGKQAKQREHLRLCKGRLAQALIDFLLSPSSQNKLAQMGYQSVLDE
ncbi:molybdate ABC transporter substrate-binding protein [Ningiella sp. W23]|uniref:molybdate ABC transporter substrate-binding protein n=1 Tax=Ningiella sp. W23 TaxID=3023715 RepID=UPI003756F9A3